MKIVLVTGGARAGKSNWAVEEALSLAGSDVTFLATAWAEDAEMEARIAAHRRTRPSGWTTIECPRNVAGLLRSVVHEVVLLDCLTLLTANRLAEQGGGLPSVQREVEDLLAVADSKEGTLLVVTNEVGMGIVPDNPLARSYRDALGWANARVARSSDRAVLLVSGVPIELK